MGATKFIIIGNYDSIARFRCMYRCYSCCCHNSDSPIIKKKSKELTLRIKSITPFQANQESSERTLRRENDSFFQDIESDLEQAFNGRYITFREGKQFMEYYIESFNEVNDFLKRIETFHVEPSETITKFVSDFENLQWFIKNHNTRYTKEELDVHKDFSTIA